MIEPLLTPDATRRTAQPFVFRSGGVLGGKKVWTIRDAIRHVDRHPAVGIYHLYNGTLAQWLEAEGAADLAQLARDAVVEARTDHRKALTIFLVGTGLTPRPRLVVEPKTLDLGYAIAGEKVGGHFYLQCDQGRGYLLGSAESGASWLRVWPHALVGCPIELAVTADTGELLIRKEQYQGCVLVKSNASAAPLQLPVRLRVVAEPTPVTRFVCRPAAGLLSSLVPGALAGWLWGQVAPTLPPQLTAALHLESAAVWMVAVMALWAMMGLVRGLCQPLPWPIPYALRVWLSRLALWGLALALASFGLAVWWQSNFGPSGQAHGFLCAQVAAAGLALAVVPATVFALRRHPMPMLVSGAPSLAEALGDGPSGKVSSRPRERARRAIWAVITALFVVLVLVFVPPLARISAAELATPTAISSFHSWLGEQLEKLNTAVNEVTGELYLRLYDRRAPLPLTP